MNIYRTLILTTALIFSLSLSAQRNIIKLGLPQLTYKSINVGYEHMINRKLSFNLTTNFQMPNSFEGGIVGNALNTIDEESINLTFSPNREFKGYDVIPEFRFYLKGKKKKDSYTPTGFFVSVLAKYSKYSSVFPFQLRYGEDKEFTYEEETYSVTGQTVSVDVDSEFEAEAFAAGIGLGGQWMLNKAKTVSMGVDLGVGWGFSNVNGNVVAIRESITFSDPELQAALGPDEINALIDAYTSDLVEDFQMELDNSDMPFSDSIDMDLKADGNVLVADGKTPWILVRLGLTVGYAF